MNTGVLIISAAIPVVMFALWKEYFEQDWNDSERAEPEDEQSLEGAIARIRLAGLLTTTLQLVIFMATYRIRQEDPLAGVSGLWITLAGLVAQRIQQASLEHRVTRSALKEQATSFKPVMKPVVMTGQVLWAFAGLVVYLGLLGGSLLSTALAISFFKMTGIKAAATLVVGTLVGYTLALASNFVLSPWFMKRILPGSSLGAGKVRESISLWFKAAGTPEPELRVFEQTPNLLSAWVTGISSLKGPFRPVLWLTPMALELLEEDEIEAVVKHEMIHLKKNHLLQRFALAWAMSLLVLVTLSAALGLAAWLPKEQAGPILPAFSLFLGVALVWGSIRAIQEQSRLHELEADLLCITELGARASALASALRKAERINGAATSRSHPGLGARLEALEPLLRQEKAQTQDSERSQRAA